MKQQWVNFAEVKQVSLEQVVNRYGLKMKRKKGDALVGLCPFHKDTEASLNISLAKNCYHCFGCDASGNVIDFVAAKEGVEFREAALRLMEWFGVGGNGKPSAGKVSPRVKTEQESAAEKPQVRNPPLGFELRVDAAHEYGRSRGLTKETIEYFGAGLCVSRGTFSGRWIVGLHNPEGQLVGYAGRSIDGGEPKYLFPSNDKGFYKSHLLFNLHRVLALGQDEVIVVEGFFDCMRLHEAGFPGAVALMGCTMSEEQETLLQKFSRVVVMLDGDEAGEQGARNIIERVARNVWVRRVVLEGGTQPDVLSATELEARLAR